MTSAIQYQGRKARRAGSEQRRKTILEAALQIIVREGVRSVRHRAVAREADVPLSATTYYFKDISDLISDTFTLFAERAMTEVIEPFNAQVMPLLEQFDASSIDDANRREEIINTLADMTAAFIINEVLTKREHLIAERAFMQEALLDDRLRSLADLYTQKQVDFMLQACEKLRTPEPRRDAHFLMANIMHIEYRLLIDPEAIDQENLKQELRYLMLLLVGKRESQ